MQVVIFDLDGTLADIHHRREKLSKDSPDWKAFHASMVDDIPNQVVVDLYRALWESGKYKLVIVSGRSDEFRIFTEQWLFWNEIPVSELLMRKRNDYRPDYIIKEELLKEIINKWGEIAFVVDDRQQVVDMWRKNGIVCLQCDVGNF